MGSNDVIYLLALHTINGLGSIRLKRLHDYFGDFKTAWQDDPKNFTKLGIPKSAVEVLLQTRQKLDPQEYFQKLENLKIKFKTIFDSDYPNLLKQISDPPIIFYYLGNLPKNLDKSIAVVGIRKITRYGKLIMEKFASNLAEFGLVIVSGLARGVDTVAHQSALEINGQTVAVLGGGFGLSDDPYQSIFPPENINLARKIVLEGQGLIITEFAPNSPSLPGNFPSRNRIISGLSLATLVTETAEDSGSLIAAKEALDQGRDFAIPGPISSDYSKGTSLLIKQGARVVTEPEEIIEELGVKNNGQGSITGKIMIQFDMNELSEVEKRVLSLLEVEKHIDQISRKLDLPSAQVSASLIKMEIIGCVKNVGSGVYVKTI